MRHARSVTLAAVAGAFACASLAAAGPAGADGDAALPAAVKGIDAACNAYRKRARPADVIRLARVAEATGSLGGWHVASDAAIERVEDAPGFRAGDFATVVLDRGAVVAADVAHDDGAAETVFERGWCFIGGKLARTTAQRTVTTRERTTGYRRILYFGDDLGQPLDDRIVEVDAPGTTFVPPSNDVLALLVTEPAARPSDLPIADAIAAARAGTLPHL
jgi:hypothetical protein